MPLPIAISPCPNDTFAFHAWTHGLIEGEPVDPTFGDIQHLNEWAVAQRYPLIKLSFATLGRILDHYTLLPSGAALGDNCGPMLLASAPYSVSDIPGLKIAVPGKGTTAYLLMRALLPDPKDIVFCTYEEVVPMIKAGKVDAGLVIHETRFTYASQGISCMVDVGQLWEETHGVPIPLGGIAVHRDLGIDRMWGLQQALERSIHYAWEHPDASQEYVLAHSIEKDPDVVKSHIDLYVNRETARLSDRAIAAVDHLFSISRQKGLLPAQENTWLLEAPCPADS